MNNNFLFFFFVLNFLPSPVLIEWSQLVWQFAWLPFLLPLSLVCFVHCITIFSIEFNIIIIRNWWMENYQSMSHLYKLQTHPPFSLLSFFPPQPNIKQNWKTKTTPYPPHHTNPIAQNADPFPSSECVSISVSEGQWGKYYYIPQDRLGRHVTITQKHAAGSFDPDVYFRWNQNPTRSDYDGADFSTETTATLNIYPTDEQRTTANKLYIGVYSYSGSGSVDICFKKYDCLNQN